jgi:hypothetical protein
MLFFSLISLGSFLWNVCCFQIANQKHGGDLNFKWLAQDEGRTDFSENLRTSLFNDNLSNEPTFSQIHVAGQYL